MHVCSHTTAKNVYTVIHLSHPERREPVQYGCRLPHAWLRTEESCCTNGFRVGSTPCDGAHLRHKSLSRKEPNSIVGYHQKQPQWLSCLTTSHSITDLLVIASDFIELDTPSPCAHGTNVACSQCSHLDLDPFIRLRSSSRTEFKWIHQTNHFNKQQANRKTAACTSALLLGCHTLGGKRCLFCRSLALHPGRWGYTQRDISVATLQCLFPNSNPFSKISPKSPGPCFWRRVRIVTYPSTRSLSRPSPCSLNISIWKIMEDLLFSRRKVWICLDAPRTKHESGTSTCCENYRKIKWPNDAVDVPQLSPEASGQKGWTAVSRHLHLCTEEAVTVTCCPLFLPSKPSKPR